MHDEKLKQVLNKIGQTNVPPEIGLLAEQSSRNFSAAIKISQPRHWLLTPVRLIAAAAVLVLAFALGRWTKPVSPKATIYAAQSSTRLVTKVDSESFWRQKAMAAMQSKPHTRSAGELLNLYKQYLKEKQSD
jgi:hypothetical protein